MTAPAGHVATTVPPVGDDTHTVENKPGELATDALTDLDRVALPVRDAMKPAETDADADRETDLDAVTLPVADTIRPPVFEDDRDAERDADELTDAGADLLAERDAERDADADTLKPRVCDLVGDGVGDTSTHCT